MPALALIAALLTPPLSAQTCRPDDTCPYRCARVYPSGASYCSACCVAQNESDREESAPLVFFDRPRLAEVGRHTVSFFELPAGSSVTVDGKSANGPLALSGNVSRPDVEPRRVLTFAEPIARAKRPQRNGQRFLVCTDSRGTRRPAKRKDARARFCGVLDVSGEVVFEAPKPVRGGWVEALALSEDGTQAAFEYGRAGALDSYVLWSESVGAKRHRADPKDMTLRRALDRLGINEDFPE